MTPHDPGDEMWVPAAGDREGRTPTGPPIAYVAHPVGSGPDRATNLARAMRWLRWLIAREPDVSFVLPWHAYCSVLEETPENRARGIRDDLAVLRRCDWIFLVGGRVSPGMAIELAEATRHGLRVVNLTETSEEPPALTVLASDFRIEVQMVPVEEPPA